MTTIEPTGHILGATVRGIDLLVWDHIGTLHNAIADYGPEEHRLMKRCQVMADRIFDPGFVRSALGPMVSVMGRP